MKMHKLKKIIFLNKYKMITITKETREKWCRSNST